MRLFSRNFAAALLAGTALAGFVAQSAFAQEAKTETPAVEDQATDTRTPAQSPTRGEPVKVGKFYLNSGASVSRVYDDNVFATNTGKTSDWSTVYSGFARLESDFDRNELNIYAGGDTSRYSSQKNEDYTDYFAGFDGKVDITDSHALFGGAEYERSHEARTSADDVNGIKPTIYSDKRAFGGYTGKFDNTSVRLGGTADIMNFDDVASSNGIINNDDRDRNMYELGLRVSQQIVQGFELFGQGVLDDRVYKAAKDDNGYDRDSSGYRLGGGAAVRLSGDVYAEGFGGAMSQNYDDPRFETVTTPYFGGSLSAPLSNDTLIRASLSRTINETTVSGSSSSVSTSAGFTLYSNLTDDLEGTVYLGLIKDKFQDIRRTDNIKQAGASLRYWLLPWVYLEGGYDYIGQDSDVANNDYANNLFTFTLGTELAAPRNKYRYAPREQKPFDGLYAGIQGIYDQFRDDQNGPRDNNRTQDSEYAAWTGGGGAYVGYGRRIYGNYYAGAEMEYNRFSDGWDQYQVPSGRIDSGSMKKQVGAALRGGYVINDDFLIYGRFGLSQAEFKQELVLGDGRQFNQSFTENALQYGAGAEALLGDGFSLRMEYVVADYTSYEINRKGPGGGAPDKIENFDNKDGQLRVGVSYQLGAWNEQERQQRRTKRDPNSFAGFYTGVQGNYEQLNTRLEGARDSGASQKTAHQGATGLAGGLNAGYGMLFGKFYLGGELEGDLGGPKWDFSNLPSGRIQSVEKKYDIAAALRGGYVVGDSILLYGKVGAASANFDSKITVADGSSYSQDDTQLGLRVGAGMETLVSDRMSMKMEYVTTYYDTYDFPYQDGGTSLNDSHNNSDGSFRIGLTYHY